MTFYKIRHKTTGLFSVGGVEPRFNKRGKTWATMAHVKLHLSGVRHYAEIPSSPLSAQAQEYLNSIEIVEYSTTGETIVELPKE
jgi:hypothetical protein